MLRLAGTIGLLKKHLTIFKPWSFHAYQILGKKQSSALHFSSQGNDVTIRPVKEKDLKFISDITIAEHWNYPVYYLETLRQISPDGFLVAENREGQIVGVIRS
ncbi:uncharacterized protein LOC144360113 [Saccoglossus kowalevskii]